MHKRLFAFCALTAIIGSGAYFSVYAQGTPHAPPTPPVPHEKNEKEPHPEMMRAKKQLQAAKESLQKSAHDYHGHRVKAINLVDQAIKEIDAGIASDKH